MFWKRATPNAAFTGLLLGILGAMTHYALYAAKVIAYRSDMAANFYQAIWAFSICLLVTVAVSFWTAPKSDADLVGLVYALTPRPRTEGLAWYARPGILALGILGLCVVLNIIFW